MGSLRTGQERDPLTKTFDYTRDGYTKDGIAFRLRPAQATDAEAIAANIQAVCAEQVYLYTDHETRISGQVGAESNFRHWAGDMV